MATRTICQRSIADYNGCLNCAQNGCRDCKLAVQLVNAKIDKRALEQKDKLVIRFIKKGMEGFHVDAMVKSQVYDVAYLYAKTPHAFSCLPVQQGVSGDTASVDSWRLAKHWLDDCVGHHSCAASAPGQTVLPTRVLDLEAPGAGQVCIHESSNQVAVYACLSHRWGNSQPLKTENATLSRFKVSIKETDLPKTFLDAVKMTRYLGIRYLWIDSLCIIQDNEQDWNREAAKMAEIYQNARVTLAATISDGADSGLFQRTAAATDVELFTLTHNNDHKGIFIINPSRNTYHGLQGSPELLQRGWVMQERFLSARLLHFSHELVFECRESRRCECSDKSSTLWPETLAYKRNSDETALQNKNPRSVYAQWYFVLAHYSTLKLTFDSDVLPALSGLAKVFHKYIHGDYIAGLWKDFLFSELTWMVRAPKSSKRREAGTAPNHSAVPTFSWASVKLSKPTADEMKDYPTQFRTKGGPNEDWGLRWIQREQAEGLIHEKTQYKCEIVSSSCKLTGPDAMGKINEAHVVLKGILYPTSIKGLRELFSSCEPHIGDDEQKCFYPDFDFLHPDHSQQGLAVGTQLYCFMLQSYEGRPADGRTTTFDATRDAGWALSLVLKRVKDWAGGKGEFERVGIMEYQGGAMQGKAVAGRNKSVPWSEEIRKKAGSATGVVKDAIIKIV